jgi:predicted RNase H-like nuclease (RuvC/YqgF family)
MKYRNQFMKFKTHFKEGEGGGEGGGGAGEGEGEENTPDVTKLMEEVERLRKHTETLLGEKKAEADKRREAEEAARKQAEEKARKENDYEQLHKSSEEKRLELQNQYEELKGSVANEKRSNAAFKIASDIADGANIDILSTFISQRLKYTDDGIKVTDASGNLTVSSLDDLKAEFKNDAKFASLVRGSQASGGGATGGKNSGGAAKEMTRDEFNKLDPQEQSTFMKEVNQGKAALTRN